MSSRERWKWPVWKAGAILALFLSIDIPFLAANLFKFFDGGYVPMLIGAFLIAAMLIWMRGRNFLLEQHLQCYPTYADAKPEIEKALTARVPGTGIFISPTAEHIPPILVHHVKCNRCLHETVVLLNVCTTMKPSMEQHPRYEITELDKNCYRLVISFGYMEVPNIIPVLEHIAGAGIAD